jgi:fatty-acyl-CoA synthase
MTSSAEHGGKAMWAVSRHELTPVTFLERAGDVYGTRVAVVDGARTFTYAGWRARARQFAAALRQLGVDRGARVAFLAQNCEELLLAHFAVPLAGGVLVALNTRLKPPEIAGLVEHSGTELMFVAPALCGSAADVAPHVRTITLGMEFEQLLAAHSGAEPLPLQPVGEDDPISINYTSGTTGSPKGVIYTHRGAALNALGLAIEFQLTSSSRHLWVLPLFHCNGWCFPWALASVGAASVCVPTVDPAQVWGLLLNGGITHYAGAPVVHAALLNDESARRLPQRVVAASGGAAPSPTLIARMIELNIQLRHIYGLTETYGPFTANVPPVELDDVAIRERAGRTARQGFAHVTAGQVRVVNPDMTDVAADGATLGEVVMRGNGVMAGYFRDPAATEEAFRGGWFHSGDLAVRHPNGEIEIRDRIKDIVISGGENISTIEVEQVLLSHPAVAECAVVGIPDDRWGEVGKAFVALRPGWSATADELARHCRERLAHYKCPKEFDFGPLPKNATGKVQKFQLRMRERSQVQDVNLRPRSREVARYEIFEKRDACGRSCSYRGRAWHRHGYHQPARRNERAQHRYQEWAAGSDARRPSGPGRPRCRANRGRPRVLRRPGPAGVRGPARGRGR